MTLSPQRLEKAAEAPLWTPDGLSRLLGAVDGYVHSIVAIRRMIASFDSLYCGRYPKHHTRKIERRNAITKPLREVADRLESDMRNCQEVYQREWQRARSAELTERDVG
jgi:hypothetical protein